MCCAVDLSHQAVEHARRGHDVEEHSLERRARRVSASEEHKQDLCADVVHVQLLAVVCPRIDEALEEIHPVACLAALDIPQSLVEQLVTIPHEHTNPRVIFRLRDEVFLGRATSI
jgi:hypothetical protein